MKTEILLSATSRTKVSQPHVLYSPLFLKFLFFIVFSLCWLCSGCKLQGYPLDASGKCWHPQLVFDGSEMGIIYYHREQGQTGPGIKAVKVTKKGAITLNPKTIVPGPLYFNDGEFTGAVYNPTISNLIWNPASKQFAFAYSNDSWIYFLRFDSSFNQIGKNSKTYAGQNLNGVSLAWDSKANEYCMTYIIDPPLNSPNPGEWKESNLRCMYFSPYGDSLHNSAQGISLDKGEKYKFGGTSVVYNPAMNEYAVAYHSQLVPKICFFNPNGIIGFVNAGPGGSYKYEIRLILNSDKEDYLATEFEYGGSMNCLRISQNHNVMGSFSVKDTFRPVYCAWPYNVGGYRYVLCASRGLTNGKRQIIGWGTTDTQHINQNFLESTQDKVHKQPSLLILPDGFYLAWIQDDVLYFDNPKINL